ncbi:hypothetical protein CK203_090434 [Vitis vinifera]|uniref:Retrotransposon Copia-like N-terminal domain-containing protein n=1 Tax=Vitis vinifera TaxID=29760 RepID=A0A438BVP6_VITVI|nr:hypothetical protein CK203_090434 [Vitis vinifera]
MTEVLTKNQTQTHLPTYDTSAAQMGIKLDGTNYALWSQVVEMYILAKTNWDISMVISYNLNLQIRLSDDGKLRMQLSKGG